MGNTASNVSQAKPNTSGAVYAGLLSDVETIPSSSSETLDTTVFRCLGYVSDEGVRNNDSVNAENVKAWGGDVVLTTKNGKEDTFTFTLMESKNADTLKTIYGEDNVVTGDDDIHISSTDIGPDEYVFVIDMILRGGIAKRIVIPDGMVRELGEIAYVDNDAIKYPVTISAMADSNSITHHEYIAIGE